MSFIVQKNCCAARQKTEETQDQIWSITNHAEAVAEFQMKGNGDRNPKNGSEHEGCCKQHQVLVFRFYSQGHRGCLKDFNQMHDHM